MQLLLHLFDPSLGSEIHMESQHQKSMRVVPLSAPWPEEGHLRGHKLHHKRSTTTEFIKSASLSSLEEELNRFWQVTISLELIFLLKSGRGPIRILTQDGTDKKRKINTSFYEKEPPLSTPG
uniref:Uncharacterized protein n=1 Tax=Sphaerodactylus townsendi TaxID=933632 RepID=A0ACB8FJW6_9SAUR